MHFLFAAKNAPGHTDFGGEGFVRLAADLTTRGHRVDWLAHGERARYLEGLGFRVTYFKPLADLSLSRHLLRATETSIDDHQLIRPLLALKALAVKLRELRPDAMCLDRDLALAPLAANRSAIPFIAVGTPGGDWVRLPEQGGTFPCRDPVERYRTISGFLASSLGWRGETIGSCWVNSPYLNINFLGSHFYPEDISLDRCASVSLFGEPPPSPRKLRIGVSFGNSGDRIEELTAIAIQLEKQGLPVEVVTGRNEALADRLRKSCDTPLLNIRGWSDFSTLLPKLSALLFFGGTGALWHCINARVPAVVLSGGRGDQSLNAGQVEHHGIGLRLPTEFSPEKVGEGLILTLTDSNWRQSCRARMNKLRCRDRFSDSLDSVCGRIERITALHKGGGR